MWNSLTIILSSLILAVLCLSLTSAYEDSEEPSSLSTNDDSQQQPASHLFSDNIDSSNDFNYPSFYDRFIRTTKFPRIGRSLGYGYDYDAPLLKQNSLDRLPELLSFEQRSVLFPRIGKRAFHNLLWANGRTNPHRILDANGRYLMTNYDYPQRPEHVRWRGKRSSNQNA